MYNNKMTDHTKMFYTYIKIDMTYKGFPVYYKQPNLDTMFKARKYNEKYIYYMVNEKGTKCLGKFKKTSKHNSNRRDDDYDYNVYEFTEGEILAEDMNTIYCSLISEESPENMIEINNTKYKTYSVYYKQL
jgi:predicted metalloendopeptidase